MQGNVGTMNGSVSRSWGNSRALLPALLCIPMLALAQTNLDDLQKQLDQARQQKAAQQAKPVPAKKSVDSPAPAPAAVGRQATLVIEADAACELRVDGVSKSRLRAGQPVTVLVEAGQQLLDCVSSEASEVKVRRVVDAKAGTKEVVMLELASAIGRASRQATGGDSWRDVRTELTWTRADNGRDIDWPGARAWCAGKGSGWDLPTVVELQSLFNKSLPGTRCGTSTCRVADPLQLTQWWFWSREADGPSRARGVNLGSGFVHSSIVGDSGDTRALCVRRP